MKILRRYIIKEFVPSFLLGFFIFTFVLFVSNFFPLARIFFDERIGLKTTGELLFYIIFLILPYSMPMGILLGSINCFNRLSHEGETVGLESCGLAPSVIIYPILGLSILISLLCFYFHSQVSPSANLGIKTIQEKFKVKELGSIAEEKVLMDNFKNYKIYIDKIDNGKIEGITVFELRAQGAPSVITAKEGEIITPPGDKKQTLKLINGTIDQIDETSSTGFTKADFKTHSIELEPIKGSREVNKKPWDMKLKELQEGIRDLRKEKTIPYHLLTEMHKRFSLSFSPVFFFLAGYVLGIKMKGKNRIKGFGLSLPVIIVYYALLLFCERTGQKGIFSPLILMWMPNIFLIIFCAPYFLKKET